MTENRPMTPAGVAHALIAGIEAHFITEAQGEKIAELQTFLDDLAMSLGVTADQQPCGNGATAQKLRRYAEFLSDISASL